MIFLTGPSSIAVHKTMFTPLYIYTNFLHQLAAKLEAIEAISIASLV